MRNLFCKAWGGALAVLFLFYCGGCAGPQPLATAIHTVDEQAYNDIYGTMPATSKAAYYVWKAATTGLSPAEIAVEDAGLSTTRNPFDARTDSRAVSRGAVVYKYNCQACHGQHADGRGPKIKYPQQRMDSHAFAKRFAASLHGGAPRAWFKKISKGYASPTTNPDGTHNAMPPFEDLLAREQIWLAITYFQSLDIHAHPDPHSQEEVR